MSFNEFKTPYKPRHRPDKSKEATQAWTSARCQRLLRPLLSRIASLRRDAAASLLNPKDDEVEQERRVDVEQQNAGCGWLRPRKRIRLTYSQRRPSRRQGEKSTFGKDQSTVKCPRQGEERSTIPGEIVPATPLLRRARGHVVPSPVIQSNPGDQPDPPAARCKRSQHKDLDQRLAKLRAQSAPNRHGDLEAIYKSLEALLKATRCDTNQTRGPRSFLEICLRKVPQYIGELEAWERMEAEQNGTVSTLDDVDASAQIYNHLESIGTNEALGWKHLRVVVRANGVDVVKQGILEGLFGDDFSELLIDLCVQSGALSEAEELVAALVDRQYPQPTAPDSSFGELASLRPLTVLWTFANKNRRTSFLLRQHSYLLSNGNLPQDWLATREFERIWALAARHLSVVEAAHDAVAFMSHSILLLCRRRRSPTSSAETIRLENDISMANKQTLVSALTMLATMGLLGEMELHSPCVSEPEIAKIDLIGNRVRHIIRSCMADLQTSRLTRSGLGNNLLYLAFFISSSNARADNDICDRLRLSIEHAWRQHTDHSSARSNRTKHRLTDVASFVSSVARSCGRGMSLASHNCLDTLFRQLESLQLNRKILDCMKAVAAFSLAQQTNNIKDFIYAEKLASNQCSGVGDDAHSRSLFTGYRWEETIGEWVKVSPVAERRLPRPMTRQLRSPSRSDVDHREDDDEQKATRFGMPIYGEADNVPGPEIEPQRDYCKAQGSPAPRAQSSNTKKRARSCSKDDKPQAVTASHRSKSVAALRSTKSAYLLLDSSLNDELGSDKENSNHIPSKKLRRSISRGTALSNKPRSSLASQISVGGLGDDFSDDELCM